MDDSNILQADATVIAGLLILLTVAYTLERRSAQEVIGEFAAITVMRISRLVIAVVIPFSVSAILVILGNVFGFWSYTIMLVGLGKYTITLTDLGKYAMIIGFGALAIGISWLLGGKAAKRIKT